MNENTRKSRVRAAAFRVTENHVEAIERLAEKGVADRMNEYELPVPEMHYKLIPEDSQIRPDAASYVKPSEAIELLEAAQAENARLRTALAAVSEERDAATKAFAAFAYHWAACPKHYAWRGGPLPTAAECRCGFDSTRVSLAPLARAVPVVEEPSE